MKLFPQDLRERQYTMLVKRRAYGVRGRVIPQGYEGVEEVSSERRIGPLGRWWMRGSGLSDAQAAASLPAASMATQGWPALGYSLLSLLGGMAALIAAKKGGVPPELALATWTLVTAGMVGLGLGPGARWAFRNLHEEPLTETEVDILREKTDDSLTRAFLDLVRDAVRQEVSDPPASQVRAGIAALAEAIDRLPEVVREPVDTAALRAEADTLSAQSLDERDRLTADSLERRADALRRRATSAELSALTAKRTHALRAEIQAQIEALREGIVALTPGSQAHEVADLSTLAETVRRVASEATASADARAELAGYPTAVASEETPATVQVRS